MKRRLAMLLSVLILIATMMPLQVLAEADKGLENALTQVKSIFTIPDDYTEFNYDINTYSNKRIWNLNWQSKKGAEGSMNVSLDDKGNILSYYSYKPYDYSEVKKLPEFSKQQAREVAEEFIKRINPNLIAQLIYQDNNDISIQNYEYYFNYTRSVEGVPYYANTVSVSIDRNSGEVRNYNYNWNDELVFPSVKGVISIEKAQQAFKDNNWLELQYLYTYDNDKIKVFPAYVQKNKYNSFIDAFTGEKVELSQTYYTNYDQYSAVSEKMAIQAASGDNGGKVVLTNDELQAIEKVSKLISKEEAEKIARNLKVLELTDEFKLNYSGLSRNWPNRDEFVWRMEFNSNGSDKTNSRYVSVSINAANGEVKDFNTYYNHKDQEEAKYDEAAAKAAAEALLKELQPAKFNETYFDGNNNNNRIMNSSEKPVNYNLAYTRKVNGVPFQGNVLRVGYDAVQGKITSYNAQWFNAEFPSVDKALPIETIYGNMLEDIGIELQYVTEPKPVDLKKEIYNPDYQQELNVKLVYGVKPFKPVLFDAYTGDNINYNGQPYKVNNIVEYSDISGHYAESQIKVLAEYGIALEGKEFKPDENITQKDFLILLSKTLNYYYEPYASDNDEQTDDLYTYLKRSGIIKDGEKAPDAMVTKEDAVKFIIRAMKADKIADIKGIYICEFEDSDQINPDLVGYVAIAKGMNIISGFNGYFNPKTEITRAEAAVVIYNYLQN